MTIRRIRFLGLRLTTYLIQVANYSNIKSSLLFEALQLGLLIHIKYPNDILKNLHQII